MSDMSDEEQRRKDARAIGESAPPAASPEIALELAKLDSRMREESLVYAVLAHPAGFDVDLFGGLLCIRSTDQATVEVDWEDKTGKDSKSFSFAHDWRNPQEKERVMRAAVRFFVEMRHQRELGVDYETKAYLKSKQEKESP